MCLFYQDRKKKCEIELAEFNVLKKFDDFLKVLSFYHVERCEHEDCSQCYFTVNLHYLYVEHCVQQKTDLESLKNYCRMRKLQFMCARLFIRHLAELKKYIESLRRVFVKRYKYGTIQRAPKKLLFKISIPKNKILRNE